MSKSYKLKDDNYIDSSSIVHNRHILADIIYPVGSVYISINNTNPQNLFGGTWEQIKDRFLLACGNTYSNGSTGGEATHLLTENEMPSHNHTQETNYGRMTNMLEIDGNYGFAQGGAYTDRTVAGTTATTNIYNTSYAGGNQAHNNMPPYLAVFIWKRTA